MPPGKDGRGLLVAMMVSCALEAVMMVVVVLWAVFELGLVMISTPVIGNMVTV